MTAKKSTAAVAIVARKGGVGKSTLAVLLGRGLASCGVRVGVVDLDPQATTTRVLSNSNGPVQGLGERLCAGESIDDLCGQTMFESLTLVASSEALSLHETALATDPMGVPAVAQSLASILDIGLDLVLVDTPPSLGPLTFGALVASRWALVPSLCEDASIQSLPNALRAIGRARTVNPSLQVLGIVPNRLERSTRHGIAALQIMQRSFGDLLVRTAIPKAAAIADAIRPGCPLDPRSPAALAVAELVDELLLRMVGAARAAEVDDRIDCNALDASVAAGSQTDSGAAP